jgi:serine/threonine-protein kinase RsbT
MIHAVGEAQLHPFDAEAGVSHMTDMPVTDGSSTSDLRLPIDAIGDVVGARHEARALACRLGFTSTDATVVATAVSELARNIILYADRGEILLKPLDGCGRPGVVIIARDAGPGISDIQRAVRGGYPTSGGLGLGLRGVKRLMDEFEITSAADVGTTVLVTKWSAVVACEAHL